MDFRDELTFLAYTIAQEAGGEPPEGQLGVAWVVVNRMRKSNLSLTDVIFRSMQFSCWNSDSPTRMKLDTLPYEVLRQCYQMACAAYFGFTIDSTGGATHYLNEEVTRQLRGGTLPGWFAEEKVTKRIGRHTFLKVD